MEQLELKGNTVKEIYSILQKSGYKGSYSGVRVVVESLRKERKHSLGQLNSIRFSRRNLSSWIWKYPEQLNSKETAYLHYSLKKYPDIQILYQEIQQFRMAIRSKEVELFLNWLRQQLTSRKNHFYYYAFRLRTDIQAIKNALTLPYNNGLLEGQINRLKTIKRMTYGRASLSLLEKRIFYKL